MTQQKGFLIIGNSTKPTFLQAESLNPIAISNVARWPIQYAIDHGYKVFMGINRNHPEQLVSKDGLDITFYDQHSYRSLFAVSDNWHAFRNLYKLLKSHPEIEIIHCNTPVGGLVGRICGKLCGVKTIIYTAHGFHFYKGAPFFNNTIIKLAEKIMARWTDAILTMNEEDYIAAQSFKLKANGKVYYVPGVGVDSLAYEKEDVNRNQVLSSLSLPQDSLVAIAMGDIVPRKNYRTAIEAIALSKCKNVHYLICGKGSQITELQTLADELGISSQIHFLGFRDDIKQLALSSDFFLFSSLQEGLPRSTMEAMCAGLPCIVSKVRGNVDLISDGIEGILVDATDVEGFSRAIQKLASNSEFRQKCGLAAKQKVKNFDNNVVNDRIIEIYNDILTNRNY